MSNYLRRFASVVLSIAMSMQIGMGNSYIVNADEKGDLQQEVVEQQPVKETSTEEQPVTPEVMEEEVVEEPTGEEQLVEEEPEVPTKEEANKLIISYVDQDGKELRKEEKTLADKFVEDEVSFEELSLDNAIEGYTLKSIEDKNDMTSIYTKDSVKVKLTKATTELVLTYEKNEKAHKTPMASSFPAAYAEKEYPEYLTADEFAQLKGEAPHVPFRDGFVNLNYNGNGWDCLLEENWGYGPRHQHYISIRDNATGQKGEEISYIRCDVYGGEKPNTTYYEVTFVNTETNERLNTSISEGLVLSEDEVPKWENGYWTVGSSEGTRTEPVGYKVNGPVTFYWHKEAEAEKVSITYDGNAGENKVDNLPENATLTKGEDYIIPDKVPTRDGYIFKEWSITKDGEKDKYQPGDEFKNIQNNLTLYAQWNEDKNDSGKDDKDEMITVTFRPGDHGKLKNADKDGNVVSKLLKGHDTYPAAPEVTAEKDWGFKGWDKEVAKGAIPMEATDLEYTANYFEDKNSDLIPDNCQVLVVYKVVQGTWNDGTSEAKSEYVTLFKDGKMAEDGQGKLSSVPAVGEKPATGYKVGQWKPDPSQAITKKSNKEFTYTYEKDDSQLKSLSYKVNHIVDGTLRDTDTETKSVWINDSTTSLEVKPIKYRSYEGYCVDKDATGAIPKVVGTGSEINIYYVSDEIGTDPENPGTGDNVPDKYQVRVSYQAVNGVVAFNEAYVTLYDGEGNYSKNGVGYLTASQIPAARANAGYSQASMKWDVLPTTSMAITKDTVFTVSFDANPVTPVAPGHSDNSTPRGDQPVLRTPVQDTEDVPENETPRSDGNDQEEVEEIEDDATPKSGGQVKYWALINLICSVVTVLFGLLLLLSKRHKDNDDKDDEEEMATTTDEQEETPKKRGMFTRILSVLLALGSVIFFILTEDMSLPMAWVDKWTIWMLVIGVAQIVVFFVGRKWKDDEEETEEQTA